MATVLHDCRFAARTLRQQPAFTLVAVLTLALGIGANTAIFSIVSALIFKQPSIADAERVVAIQRSTKDKTIQGMVSYLELQDWRAQNRTFEAISAYKSISAVLVHDGKAERLSSLRVTENFLTFLNTNLARGRNFEPAEERRGAAPAVIISYGLWQSRFGGADSAIGSKLDLNGRPFEVIGILPGSFEFPLTQQVDLLTTVFEEGANLDERGAQVLLVIGRLKPGVGLEQAQADLSQVGAALAERYPQYNRDITPSVTRLDEHIVGTDVRRALWLLFGTVAFILLIACTNVTNLLLVRAKAREKELALRAALGAGKWQVARQLLVESLMLSLLAGVAGLLIANWGLGAIQYYGRTQLPRIDEVTIDGTVLAFTMAASLFTALLFSLLPVLKASTPPLNEILRSGGRATDDGSVRVWRDTLVVAEVALGFVLLVGAGLMLKSFTKLVNVDPGFDPKNVLLSRITMIRSNYESHDVRVQYVTESLQRLQAMPGIESAAFIAPLPFSGANVGSDFRIEGRPEPEPGKAPVASNRSVTPNYFEMMRIPLKRGRYFNEQDRRGAMGAAIINEALVRQYFDGQDPIGMRIHEIGANQNEGDPLQWEIVGVVGDVHHSSLARPATPEIYLPYRQNSWSWGHMLVRASQDPAPLAKSFGETLKSVDGAVLAWGIQPLESAIANTTAQARFYTLLFSLFGATGLVLTLTGIYGVISYSVSQRLREVGIRVALGAESTDVLKLICGRGMFLTMTGIVIGAIAAEALTRGMVNLLFELNPRDLPTFAIITLLLIATALPACWIPARRATRVDPTIALRNE